VVDELMTKKPPEKCALPNRFASPGWKQLAADGASISRAILMGFSPTLGKAKKGCSRDSP
jgi:hypothetical protein